MATSDSTTSAPVWTAPAKTIQVHPDLLNTPWCLALLNDPTTKVEAHHDWHGTLFKDTFGTSDVLRTYQSLRTAAGEAVALVREAVGVEGMVFATGETSSDVVDRKSVV